MTLSNLIGRLETENCVNSETFKELQKRITQVKNYFNLYEKINVVVEIISNTLTAYYVDTEGYQSHFDIIEKNELHEQLESGHLQVIQL